MFQAVYLGADDGNRTHTTSLEGWSSTTKLHLRESVFIIAVLQGVVKSRSDKIEIKKCVQDIQRPKFESILLKRVSEWFSKGALKRTKILKFIPTTFQKTLDES